MVKNAYNIKIISFQVFYTDRNETEDDKDLTQAPTTSRRSIPGSVLEWKTRNGHNDSMQCIASLKGENTYNYKR